MNATLGDDIKDFMSAELQQFKPFAYFDKHMDCIRVLIQDVSVTEERLSRFFTVAKPNHSATSGRHVGFTIKGVAYLFDQAAIPLSGVQELVAILDQIVKTVPHAAVKQVVEEFTPMLQETKLTVSFEEEEEELLMAA